jgi:hypothetical protein
MQSILGTKAPQVLATVGVALITVARIFVIWM